MSVNAARAVLGALLGLAVVTVPELGGDPWPFRPDRVVADGPLAPLVRAAGREWDVDVLRTAGVLAAALVVAVGLALPLFGRRRGAAVGATAAVVAALLVLPAVALQAGLRDASAPWFYTNDSTYQIDLAGELLRRGENPYGYDYGTTGLERWYSFDGSVEQGVREEQVALRHLAYFPGTPLTAAAWGVLPEPLSDYRFLVALCSLALLPAALVFRGPLAWRLALGAVLAANPLVVRAAWFGTADAPSVLFTVLAFALVTRSRYLLAAACLAVAVLLKQFALVALPFLALVVLLRAPRRELARAGGLFGALLLAGFVPFAVAGPAELWADTIEYGARTYRIIGYGLAGLLVRADLVERRGSYPFLPLALLVWLPVTTWLLWLAYRSRAAWLAAAGFAASVFVLFFLSRVFQTSYLVWPLTGLAVATLLAARERPWGEERSENR